MTPTVQHLIEELESEINNGGFDQFFFNSAGDYTAETIEALNAIGATHTAGIVKAAASRFPDGMPPKDRNERQDILEKISPDSDAFEEDDDAFLEYRDDLAFLLSNYDAAS
jgi:hypothetical protein